jgi:hypothetical protein
MPRPGAHKGYSEVPLLLVWVMRLTSDGESDTSSKPILHGVNYTLLSFSVCDHWHSLTLTALPPVLFLAWTFFFF